MFLWRMRCILRVGAGRVDCAGGVSSVCLTRRKKNLERRLACLASCLTTCAQSVTSVGLLLMGCFFSFVSRMAVSMCAVTVE